MLKQRKKRRGVVADLNLTNLIDVIFALLIIFMMRALGLKPSVKKIAES